MNSNPISTAQLCFKRVSRERTLKALHTCVFHLQFHFPLVSEGLLVHQLLWQALCGAVSSSKVTRLRGDYEWALRQPQHVRLPNRPLTRSPLKHGFLLAPVVIQFHWLQGKIPIDPYVWDDNVDIYAHHVKHVPYVDNTSFFCASKIVALAGCFCQLPCRGGCRTFEWLPLELALQNVLGFKTGLYTACLQACLVSNTRFNCIFARMTLLQHVKEVTVFPRECFYMDAEEVPEELLDLAYDLTVASLGMTPEMITFLSWMLFSPVLTPRSHFDPPASFRSDLIRYEEDMDFT